MNIKMDFSKLLIDSGADIHIKDSIGISCLEYAKMRDHLEAYNYMLEKNKNINNKTNQ